MANATDPLLTKARIKQLVQDIVANVDEEDRPNLSMNIIKDQLAPNFADNWETVLEKHKDFIKDEALKAISEAEKGLETTTDIKTSMEKSADDGGEQTTGDSGLDSQEPSVVKETITINETTKPVKRPHSGDVLNEDGTDTAIVKEKKIIRISKDEKTESA